MNYSKDIKPKVEELLLRTHNGGMDNVLTAMIELINDWLPEHDKPYLKQLREDLTRTLNNYRNRYEGDQNAS